MLNLRNSPFSKSPMISKLPIIPGVTTFSADAELKELREDDEEKTATPPSVINGKSKKKSKFTTSYENILRYCLI